MFMRAASTPHGLNFFHKLFVESIQEDDSLRQHRKLVMTSSLDNKHLAEQYISMLESTYDKMLIKQERDGLFINVNGGVTYYAFSREKNIRPCPINPSKPITIGMDFNVNPMTAVCCQQEGNKTRVVHEFYLENSNTEAMGKTIIAFFGGTRGITIIPDSTGVNRKTSSTFTDHAILRNMGFEIPRFSNPARKDRFNNVNGRLDHELLEVDPSCKHLIKDLENFVEADERKTPELGHLGDCLGYTEWYSHPINIRGVDKTKGNGVILL
jgi:hypothetical protein